MSALLLVILVIVGTSALVIYGNNQRRAEAERQEQKRAERQRIRECGEVVSYFANHFGYLARQCISRDELEVLISSGISPDELPGVILSRMEEKQGIILGYQPISESGGIEVKLTQDFRDRHIYIIGKSGSGKTNLLRNMIFQDLEIGNGLGVIAPEQEMIIEEILPYIPSWRVDDVIYFNPADTASPVSFNPLHLDEGEDIDLRVDENLTIFRRLMGEGSGPRMEEILRQGFYALLEKEGSTLLDFERLFDRDDPTFRNQVIRESRDENTVRFWRDVYPRLPKDAHLPITNRLSRLVRPRLIRNILCNPTSSLNFREAIDSGKILLFNLSDGILGELNSQLLGQLIVSKFQMAVMSRADVPKEKRRPFYLYIDEFQTFTSTLSTSYEKILSRARKYRLALILAHQQTGQIPLHLLKEIFGNVSTVISFMVSKEDAGKLAGEFITEVDGQIINIPQEEILRLRVGETWCKIGQNSMFMKTYLAPQCPDFGRAEEIIERSRRNYGISAREHAPQIVSETGRIAIEAELPSATDALEELDPGQVF